MLFLALALLGLSHAAVPEGPDLTRAQAQEAAQAKSFELLGAEAEVEAARAVARTAGELPNPTLGVSYGPDAPQLFGTIEQRFPIFGQRGSAIRAAEGDLELARAQKQVRAVTVAVAVERAYTALAAAQVQVTLAEEAALIARGLSDANAEKFKAGLASELDAEQSRLALRRAEQDVLDSPSCWCATTFPAPAPRCCRCPPPHRHPPTRPPPSCAAPTSPSPPPRHGSSASAPWSAPCPRSPWSSSATARSRLRCRRPRPPSTACAWG
jgi:hypothetical protein